jgi:hypothetical protein
LQHSEEKGLFKILKHELGTNVSKYQMLQLSGQEISGLIQLLAQRPTSLTKFFHDHQTLQENEGTAS